MRIAALALVATGCNAVFGLHTQTQDAAPPDLLVVPPGPIAATIDALFVSNDGAHVPRATPRIFPAAELSVFVVEPDGTATQLPYDETAGTFSVPRTDDTRRRIQLRAGGTVFEFQWNAPTLVAHVLSFGRRNVVQATTGTELAGTVTLPLPGHTMVDVTGVWQSYDPFFFNGNQYSQTWTGALPSAGANDQMFFIGYDPDPSGTVYLDQVATVPDIEMVAGASTTAHVTLGPASRTGCVNAVTSAAIQRARLQALFPGISSGISAAVQVVAMPMPELGRNDVAFELARLAPNIDAATMNVYGVFPGHVPVLRSVASGTSTGPDGGKLPVQTLVLDAAPETTCTTPHTLPTSDIAVGTAFQLDGHVFTEGEMMQPSGSSVVAAWTANGDTDLWLLQVYDFATATAVWQVLTTAAQATIDTAALRSGHDYALIANAFTGLPNIAAGDVTSYTFPRQQSTSSSPVFTVK